MITLKWALVASGYLSQLSSAAFSLQRESRTALQITWPSGDIKYCFGSEADRDKLLDIWKGGWQIWGANLPVRPVPQDPPTASAPEPICTNNPRGVLKITCNGEGRYYTTRGYQAGVSHSMEFDCGKRSLRITRKAIMAHEIGHAMGLLHEHQKPHAGEEIDFTCTNLRDYKMWLDEKGYNKMKTICSAQESASLERLGPPRDRIVFTAANLLPMAQYEYHYDDGQGVDFDSIMIYASNLGGQPAIPRLGERFGFRRNVLKKKDGSTFPAQERPSRRDLEQVDRLYR